MRIELENFLFNTHQKLVFQNKQKLNRTLNLEHNDRNQLFTKMYSSKSFQPRSKSPVPQSSTTPEVVPEKDKAHTKLLRNITNFNHAIDFVGLYHELHEQLNV